LQQAVEATHMACQARLNRRSASLATADATIHSHTAASRDRRASLGSAITVWQQLAAPVPHSASRSSRYFWRYSGPGGPRVTADPVEGCIRAQAVACIQALAVDSIQAQVVVFTRARAAGCIPVPVAASMQGREVVRIRDLAAGNIRDRRRRTATTAHGVPASRVC
jgi:hypothetical protein